MLAMVVCDWNRTLFRDHYEKTFVVTLSRKVFFRRVARLVPAGLAPAGLARKPCS